MTENLTCKYLLGTCYSCQKCLHCFHSLQQKLCKCEKSKQPLRTKNLKRGQQIYQRAFTPNSTFSKANKFLFDANIKFDYNSNFEEAFSYTFCGACNSKIQRLRHEDKMTQKAQENDDEEVDDNSIDDNKKENNNENNNEEYVDTEEIEEEEENYSSDDNDLEEIKVQIIVKSKD